MRRLGHQAVDAIVDQLAGLRQSPVAAPAGPADVANLLGEPLPVSGSAPDEVLRQAFDEVLSAATRLDHPLLRLRAVRWLRELFGLPTSAGGIFTDGGSSANLVGLTVARRAALGDDPLLSRRGRRAKAGARRLRPLGAGCDSLPACGREPAGSLPTATRSRPCCTVAASAWFAAPATWPTTGRWP